jgi:hypothetical protein
MNKAPEEFFIGYSFDGTTIEFQLSTFNGLSHGESHPTRGDWRDLAFSICSTLQTYYNNLDSGSRDPSFRARAVQQYPSSLGDNAVRQTYSFEFTDNITMTNPDVIEE